MLAEIAKGRSDDEASGADLVWGGGASEDGWVQLHRELVELTLRMHVVQAMRGRGSVW